MISRTWLVWSQKWPYHAGRFISFEYDFFYILVFEAYENLILRFKRKENNKYVEEYESLSMAVILKYAWIVTNLLLQYQKFKKVCFVCFLVVWYKRLIGRKISMSVPFLMMKKAGYPAQPYLKHTEKSNAQTNVHRI